MADISSRYQRVFSVTADQHGIDPLLDKLLPEIMKIKNFSIHEVTQDERGAPDWISEQEYGTDEFWWHILAYNGICSYKDIVEGRSLRIPNFAELVSIVTHNTLRPNTTSRVVTI